MDSSTTPQRKRLRLPEYNYTQPGAYYVTMVTHFRKEIFGSVVNGECQYTPFGKIVISAWEELGQRFPYLLLDGWVLMPNHFHCILFYIETKDYSNASNVVSVKVKPLGQIIGMFKTTSAKQINLFRGTPGESVWQRNYYERIIRNDKELDQFRAYIQTNPFRWEQDHEGIENMPRK